MIGDHIELDGYLYRLTAEEDKPVWGVCDKTEDRCADRPYCQCEACRAYWNYQGTEE